MSQYGRRLKGYGYREVQLSGNLELMIYHLNNEARNKGKKTPNE